MDTNNLRRLYGTTVFRHPGLDEYAGNALIESLDPIMPWMELAQRIMELPAFDPAERQMPSELRIAKLPFFADYFQTLSIHRPFADRVFNMIRHGYLKRNPMDPLTVAQRRFALANVRKRIPGLQSDVHLTATGAHMIGISGIGKTQLALRILNVFPRVRVITKYKNKLLAIVQVPWLFIETPHDGSRKSVCVKIIMAFDARLGTSYYAGYVGDHLESVSVDSLILAVASLCRMHEVGILVIDETQHLKDAKSEGSTLALNFFVELVNTLGIPILLIGTFKAEKLLTKEFRAARRGTTDGDFWWNAMNEDRDWNLYAEGLFDYQINRVPAAFEPLIGHTLYDMSQGIPALATSMFLRAQYRSITVAEETGQPEEMSSNLLWSVYEDDFRSLHKVLRALRNADPTDLMKFEDAYSEFVKRRGMFWLDPEHTKPTRVQTLPSAETSPLKAQNPEAKLVTGLPQTSLKKSVEYSAIRLNGSLYQAVKAITAEPVPSRTEAEKRLDYHLRIHSKIKELGCLRNPCEFITIEE